MCVYVIKNSKWPRSCLEEGLGQQRILQYNGNQNFHCLSFEWANIFFNIVLKESYKTTLTYVPNCFSYRKITNFERTMPIIYFSVDTSFKSECSSVTSTV